MSERTVADETLTPGASTTCWEPTGWADPMYSVTTALRMAALRASRSASPGGALSDLRSSTVGMWAHQGEVVHGRVPHRGPGRVWHSTLVSAGPTRPCTRAAVDRPAWAWAVGRDRSHSAQAEAMNIRSVMAGPRAMAASPMTRVRVPSGRPGLDDGGGARGQPVVAEVGERVGLVLDALGDPQQAHVVAGLGLGQALLGGAVRDRPRDRVAVRAGGRIVEQHHQAGLDVVGDDVLPPTGLDVGLVPVEADDVDQQPLGQAVLADHALGQRPPGRRHGDAPRRSGR